MPRKKKEEPEQELQAKYIQYQLMKQQLAAYIEKKNAVDEQLKELNATIDALHKLESVEKGKEIWSSLGSGSFVMSDIKDTEKVMIALGAGVVAKETRERAIEILQGRLEELTKIDNELTSDMTKLANVLNALESELETLAHRAKNE